MGVPSDDATPIEHLLMQLTSAITAEDLPSRMLCPSKHETHKAYTSVNSEEKIPFYICEPCKIVYRYQECTLPPGDEGHP